MHKQRSQFAPTPLNAGPRPAEHEIFLKPPSQGHHMRPRAVEEGRHG